MDFALAVKNRDALVRASIRTAIGRMNGLGDQEKTAVATEARAAFDKGVRDWEETYLEAAVGPKEAERIRALFRDEQRAMREEVVEVGPHVDDQFKEREYD